MKGTQHPVWKEVFSSPCIAYDPKEIKRIMDMLGESPAEFAERFYVSESAVKSWITPEGKPKHRPLFGPALRLMYWAAKEANERGCGVNNLIRMHYRYPVGQDAHSQEAE